MKLLHKALMMYCATYTFAIGSLLAASMSGDSMHDVCAYVHHNEAALCENLEQITVVWRALPAQLLAVAEAAKTVERTLDREMPRDTVAQQGSSLAVSVGVITRELKRALFGGDADRDGTLLNRDRQIREAQFIDAVLTRTKLFGERGLASLRNEHNERMTAALQACAMLTPLQHMYRMYATLTTLSAYQARGRVLMHKMGSLVAVACGPVVHGTWERLNAAWQAVQESIATLTHCGEFITSVIERANNASMVNAYRFFDGGEVGHALSLGERVREAASGEEEVTDIAAYVKSTEGLLRAAMHSLTEKWEALPAKLHHLNCQLLHAAERASADDGALHDCKQLAILFARMSTELKEEMFGVYISFNSMEYVYAHWRNKSQFIDATFIMRHLFGEYGVKNVAARGYNERTTARMFVRLLSIPCAQVCRMQATLATLLAYHQRGHLLAQQVVTLSRAVDTAAVAEIGEQIGRAWSDVALSIETIARLSREATAVIDRIDEYALRKLCAVLGVERTAQEPFLHDASACCFPWLR